jgi:type II secretory pathway pseudopilin PulG
LVELIVVIAILGVLAGIVTVWVGGAPDDAEAAVCQSELGIVRSAVHAANSANVADGPAGSADTPAQHLDGSTRFYGWSGSPGSWTIQAVGPIPFGC